MTDEKTTFGSAYLRKRYEVQNLQERLYEKDKRIAELEKDNAYYRQDLCDTAVMRLDLKNQILEAERRGFEAARQTKVPLGIYFSDFYVHGTFDDWKREVNSKPETINHE